MMPEYLIPEWLKAILYALLASIGGLLGYLLRTMEAAKEVSLLRAIVETFAAGFVGVLTYFLCRALHLSDAWTGAMTGLFGWLGAIASIQILEKVVYRKLGVNRGNENANNSNLPDQE